MFPTNLEIFICTKNTTLTNTAAGPTSSSGMIRGFGKFKTQFCGHLIFDSEILIAEITIIIWHTLKWLLDANIHL